MKKLVAAILALLTALSLAVPVLAQPDKPVEVVVVVVIVVARYTPQRGETLAWYYDQAGTMLGFTLNGVPYFYIRNIQGDVTAVIDQNGEVVARYQYDAWGNLLSYSGALARVNPITYRGYYFDWETGLFYLQSRYYDPVLRRFISPDVFLDTGVGILGTNVYIYCNNNPIMFVDPDGFMPRREFPIGSMSAVTLDRLFRERWPLASRDEETFLLFAIGQIVGSIFESEYGRRRPMVVANRNFNEQFNVLTGSLRYFSPASNTALQFDFVIGRASNLRNYANHLSRFWWLNNIEEYGLEILPNSSRGADFVEQNIGRGIAGIAQLFNPTPIADRIFAGLNATIIGFRSDPVIFIPTSRVLLWRNP